MKFKEWITSYSGCDGGSPDKSSIWFVGIEWGFARENGQTDEEHEEAVKAYHSGGMKEAIINGFQNPYADTYPLQEHTNYTFGRNSLKLLAAINGCEVGNYKKYVDSTPDTEIFKLNLYPIGLPTTDDYLWDKFNLADITGLPSKQAYRDFCSEHRFPFFEKELSKHAPKLILCTGSTYTSEYTCCFLGSDDVQELNCEEISDPSPKNNTPRYLYWKWINNKTLFVIVPFMTNASGLNSHNLLEQFGKRIKQILNNNR